MSSVLVIVLNYNKKNMVLDCLSSLAAQSHIACHVVVVDNASSDGSVHAITQAWPHVDLLCNTTNLGAIEGRNAGVRYAQRKYHFDYILFLDDDAEVGPRSVAVLVQALEDDSQAGIACGKTYTDFERNIIMSAGISERFRFGLCFDRGSGQEDRGQFDVAGYVDACGAFALLIRARLFEELNGFDPVFSPYGWEDVDLCLRARRLGALTRYVPEATFCHKGTRLGRGPVLAYERHKARNFLTLIQRHMTPIEALSAIFFVPLRGLLLALRLFGQGNSGAILAQIRGIRDFVRRNKGGRGRR